MFYRNHHVQYISLQYRFFSFFLPVQYILRLSRKTLRFCATGQTWEEEGGRKVKEVGLSNPTSEGRKGGGGGEGKSTVLYSRKQLECTLSISALRANKNLLLFHSNKYHIAILLQVNLEINTWFHNDTFLWPTVYG